MSKLTTARAKLYLICVALQLVCASPSAAQSNNLLNLSSEDHIVYIDILKLPTKIKVENKGIFDLFDSNRSAESFYRGWNWRPEKCSAGTLREGVIAYCLPYVGVGYHFFDPNHEAFGRFVDMGPLGILLVWYEPNTNQFYLWSAGWNFTNALGPFVGDPNVVLKQALKPRKAERHLVGVNLIVVSQRWLHPDEREARVPRDEHYDCSHGHPSGKSIEQVKLNTFMTRFRLVNSGNRDIYYLGNFSNDDPVDFKVMKFTKRTDLDRALSRSNAEAKENLAWKRLPSGSSVEFEVTEIGWQQVKEQFLGVLLNTEPVYWDEVELLSPYTSMFRSFQHVPPIQ